MGINGCYAYLGYHGYRCHHGNQTTFFLMGEGGSFIKHLTKCSVFSCSYYVVGLKTCIFHEFSCIVYFGPFFGILPKIHIFKRNFNIVDMYCPDLFLITFVIQDMYKSLVHIQLSRTRGTVAMETEK